MISKIIKLGQDITIQFLKGWIDDFGNVIPVFFISGKKYCFIGNLSSQNDWNYCFGIGSSKAPSARLPAGRGQYLTGQNVEPNFVGIIFEQTKVNSSLLQRIPNKGGASWSPKSETELAALKALVSVYQEINSYLQSEGILYLEGDRYIYGKDITLENMNGVIGKESARPTSYKNMDVNSKPQDSQNVTKFISAIRQPFQQEFGAAFNPSTSRSALEQAMAMRFPIQSGDYDSLYKRVPRNQELKELIKRKDYQTAANIILEEGYQKYYPHMLGNAIDVSFSKNNLSTGDYQKFSELVKKVSENTGINASVNSEKSTHFHITLK
jgi:hypothetical protein